MCTGEDRVRAAMKLLYEQGEAIFANRSVEHGHNNALQAMDRLGELWTVLLREHFPHDTIPDIDGRLAALMLVALKLQRASRYGRKALADDYVDAFVYLAFAQVSDE